MRVDYLLSTVLLLMILSALNNKLYALVANYRPVGLHLQFTYM